MSKAVRGPLTARDTLTTRMMEQLKRLFHANGLRYADVAGLIGVSEKSVKRYMAGQGISLPMIEKLCAAAGITLLELAELAESDEPRDAVFTSAMQEDALADDPKMAIAFYLLAIGWTAARIMREFSVPESEMNAVLTRLDRLGLITLYPANRVKVRASLRPSDKCSRRLREVISTGGAALMADADLTDQDILWRVGIVRLGPASFARAAKRFQAFVEEIAALGQQDMDLEGHQVKWYGICAMMRQHEAVGLQLFQSGLRRGGK